MGKTSGIALWCSAHFPNSAGVGQLPRRLDGKNQLVTSITKSFGRRQMLAVRTVRLAVNDVNSESASGFRRTQLCEKFVVKSLNGDVQLDLPICNGRTVILCAHLHSKLGHSGIGGNSPRRQSKPLSWREIPPSVSFPRTTLSPCLPCLHELSA